MALWHSTRHQPKPIGRPGDDGYVLSGFVSEQARDEREPTWDGAQDYGDMDEAVVAGQSWVRANGPDATVEVIAMAGRCGFVVRVVSSSGVETITDY
jgi:hypothetical protein